MTSSEKQKSGIYKITNNVNGKFYIGSAKSLSSRWRLHKSQLKNNKHHSIYLQRSFNKYGYSSFSFEIIECCEIEDLIEREQFYLDSLKPQYNMAKIAGNCLGVKHSPESNYKRGNYNRGRYGKDHNSSRPLYQYSLDGFLIKEWLSGKDVERDLDIFVSNIQSDLTKNKFTTNYNYIWSKTFEGDIITPIVYRDRSSTCKKIGMYDLDNNLVREFKSQTDAAKEFKIAQSSIGSCLKGKSKTCLKHKWKYINENT
jgi:group I intron endonuclease